MPEADFREHSDILDHTVRFALSASYTPRALGIGFATLDRARARDSIAAQGNPRHVGHFGLHRCLPHGARACCPCVMHLE